MRPNRYPRAYGIWKAFGRKSLILAQLAPIEHHKHTYHSMTSSRFRKG